MKNIMKTIHPRPWKILFQIKNVIRSKTRRYILQLLPSLNFNINFSEVCEQLIPPLLYGHFFNWDFIKKFRPCYIQRQMNCSVLYSNEEYAGLVVSWANCLVRFSLLLAVAYLDSSAKSWCSNYDARIPLFENTGMNISAQMFSGKLFNYDLRIILPKIWLYNVELNLFLEVRHFCHNLILDLFE